MKHRVEPVDGWLWGHLPSVKARIEAIKNGQRWTKDTPPYANEQCPFCGSWSSEGGVRSAREKDRQIYVCSDCRTALAYGYVTEVLKMIDNGLEEGKVSDLWDLKPKTNRQLSIDINATLTRREVQAFVTRIIQWLAETAPKEAAS